MKKNILFIVQHPAHVHQFRYLIFEAQNAGYTVKVAAIKKEITLDLLDTFKIDYVVIGENKKGLVSKILQIIPHIFAFIRLIKSQKINLIVDRGNPAATFAAWLTGTKHILFSDSEPVFIDNILLKFSEYIVTPNSFEKNYGKKHIKLNSYKELGYLNERYFKPDLSALQALNVIPGEKFFLLRFVAWNANHDIGQSGLSKDNKIELVSLLNQFGKVFISSEVKLEEELEQYRFKLKPEQLHSALHFATMLIGDSQTMTTEAALLGTPAIRINSFAGKNDMGNFKELEYKYSMIYSFRDFSEAMVKIKELLSLPELKMEWSKKRKTLLSEKEDLNAGMLRIISKVI